MIPYPDGPAHTFPAIKARELFTRHPRRVRRVYVPSADPMHREHLSAGGRPVVPLARREERFRSVYDAARRAGLDITVGAPPPHQRVWPCLFLCVVCAVRCAAGKAKEKRCLLACSASGSACAGLDHAGRCMTFTGEMRCGHRP